jgi:hypothetical protein
VSVVRIESREERLRTLHLIEVSAPAAATCRESWVANGEQDGVRGRDKGGRERMVIQGMVRGCHLERVQERESLALLKDLKQQSSKLFDSVGSLNQPLVSGRNVRRRGMRRERRGRWEESSWVHELTQRFDDHELSLVWVRDLWKIIES